MSSSLISYQHLFGFINPNYNSNTTTKYCLLVTWNHLADMCVKTRMSVSRTEIVSPHIGISGKIDSRILGILGSRIHYPIYTITSTGKNNQILSTINFSEKNHQSPHLHQHHLELIINQNKQGRDIKYTNGIITINITTSINKEHKTIFHHQYIIRKRNISEKWMSIKSTSSTLVERKNIGKCGQKSSSVRPHSVDTT